MLELSLACVNFVVSRLKACKYGGNEAVYDTRETQLA